MYNTSTTLRADHALTQLKKMFDTGLEEQTKLIAQVRELHIKDRLVDPGQMSFNITKGVRQITYGDGVVADIHRHAFGQICGTAEFRRDQVTIFERLNAPWSYKLIEHNLQTIFSNRTYIDRKKQPAKFLHRLVTPAHALRPQLRGFLSRSFNRFLASRPLLSGFISACAEVGAVPVEASTSDVFFSLKCFLPYVFEPVPGEYVAFGVTWSNSDFGRGSMTVALTATRIATGGAIVFGDAISRRHIGSVIQDSDVEISEDTARKEVDAQVSAIHDCVRHELSEESVERMCKALTEAAEKKIPWSRIKHELAVLGKSELITLQEYLEQSRSGVIDLPPATFSDDDDNEPLPTRWWVSNAISYLATKTVNPDKKADLQAAAGLILQK
jgi:hypothetical protein